MSGEGKVALVTGAATGIGRAVAVHLAQRGYAIGINYSRSEAEAQETAAQVQALGVPALLCQANVADDAAVRQMVQQCQHELGGLDLLINNAGITHFVNHQDLEALSDAIWDEILAVNLKGPFYACRAAMPLLRQRQGSIVNVSSVAGVQGVGSSIPYAASKAALNCMTKSLARAFAPEVRVNAVAPGPVLTRWLQGHEAAVERYVEQTPLGRAATPEDIADAIVFLAVDNSLITGQVLVVDGGRIM
jgi:3-oxoacyl-[acyl-carrier protein] reductase